MMDSWDDFRLKYSQEHEPKIKYPAKGYAGTPGSGPSGETCGSCKHIYRKNMGKVYVKCDLMRQYWTRGYGTDIRVRALACEKWEKPCQ